MRDTDRKSAGAYSGRNKGRDAHRKFFGQCPKQKFKKNRETGVTKERMMGRDKKGNKENGERKRDTVRNRDKER